MGKQWKTVADFIFSGFKITADGDCSHDSIFKSRDITLPTKVCLAMVFPVVMYGCESWTVKKAEGQRIDGFELWCWRSLLRVPWTWKESQPINLKGNQPWIFTGRTDVEAEAPILWPPDAKKWLIRKNPDAGKDWREEEKGTTEDVMVGWHHQLYGHEFEKAPGDGEGQGSLAWCSPWGHKEYLPLIREASLGAENEIRYERPQVAPSRG